MSNDSRVIPFPVPRISRFPDSATAQARHLAKRLGGRPRGCRRVLEQIRYCRLFERPYKEPGTVTPLDKERVAKRVAPFLVWDEELGRSVFERPYKAPNNVPLWVWEAAALPVGARWEMIAEMGLPI